MAQLGELADAADAAAARPPARRARPEHLLHAARAVHRGVAAGVPLARQGLGRRQAAPLNDSTPRDRPAARRSPPTPRASPSRCASSSRRWTTATARPSRTPRAQGERARRRPTRPRTRRASSGFTGLEALLELLLLADAGDQPVRRGRPRPARPRHRSRRPARNYQTARGLQDRPEGQGAVQQVQLLARARTSRASTPRTRPRRASTASGQTVDDKKLTGDGAPRPARGQAHARPAGPLEAADHAAARGAAAARHAQVPHRARCRSCPAARSAAGRVKQLPTASARGHRPVAAGSERPTRPSSSTTCSAHETRDAEQPRSSPARCWWARSRC